MYQNCFEYGEMTPSISNGDQFRSDPICYDILAMGEGNCLSIHTVQARTPVSTKKVRGERQEEGEKKRREREIMLEQYLITISITKFSRFAVREIVSNVPLSNGFKCKYFRKRLAMLKSLCVRPIQTVYFKPFYSSKSTFDTFIINIGHFALRFACIS